MKGKDRKEELDLEGQTKTIQGFAPAFLLVATTAVVRTPALKGTSVRKDQNASLPSAALLLSPWLESQPACIQTHLQLCMGRRERLHHLDPAPGAFKFMLEYREKRRLHSLQAQLPC